MLFFVALNLSVELLGLSNTACKASFFAILLFR